jgi:hypothetical protein
MAGDPEHILLELPDTHGAGHQSLKYLPDGAYFNRLEVTL